MWLHFRLWGVGCQIPILAWSSVALPVGMGFWHPTKVHWLVIGSPSRPR
jgi:hypothetical protein